MAIESSPRAESPEARHEARARAESTAGPAGGPDHPEAAAPSEPGLRQLLDELREAAAVYVTARVDLVKLSIRRALWAIVLGMLAGILGIAVILTAAVLALIGLSGAITDLLDSAPWVGHLGAGALVIVLAVSGCLLARSRSLKASRRRTEERYEARKSRQRVQIGRDFTGEARNLATE